MKINKIVIFFSVITLNLFIGCNKNGLNSLNDHFYVRHAGADMPVYIHGNASEKVFLLFIHGGPGDNGLQYREGIASKNLEKDYAVVYYDQRGQGLSEGKFEQQDVTISLMADDLHAVILTIIKKYGNDISIFLLGHSWGGELGTAYLLKNNYPPNVKGWIEIDGAHDVPKINVELTKMIIKVGNQQINSGNSKDKWQELISWVNKLDTANINFEQGRDLNRKARIAEQILINDGFVTAPDKKTFRDLTILYNQNIITGIFSGYYTYVNNEGFYAEIETTSYTNQLHNISLPSLFLWGKYDFIVPATLGYDAYYLVNTQQKDIIIFEQSGHMPMKNQPYKFVKTISNFVEIHK